MAKKSNNTIRFTFVGDLIIPKNFITESTTSFGTTGKRLNFGVKAGTNSEFASLYGSVRDTIHTIDADGETIDIDWGNRKDPDIIKQVASYRKFRTNIGNEDGDDTIREFITEYDFIEYLSEHLRDYKGRVNVGGQYVIRYDNKGILRKNYNINSVWKARENEKNFLGLNVHYTYWKDCVDKSDFKENGKITVNGYVRQYSSQDKVNKFFPLTVVFDANVFDMNNPKQKAQYDARMEALDVKNKTPITMFWSMRVKNGADEVPFDESQLTEFQKRMIAAGDNTLEDFRPRGQIYGDRVSEIRFYKPLYVNEYSTGSIDTGFTVSEFEDEIAQPIKDETVADMEKSGETKLPFEVAGTVDDEPELF